MRLVQCVFGVLLALTSGCKQRADFSPKDGESKTNLFATALQAFLGVRRDSPVAATAADAGIVPPGAIQVVQHGRYVELTNEPARRQAALAQETSGEAERGTSVGESASVSRASVAPIAAPSPSGADTAPDPTASATAAPAQAVLLAPNPAAIPIPIGSPNLPATAVAEEPVSSSGNTDARPPTGVGGLVSNPTLQGDSAAAPSAMSGLVSSPGIADAGVGIGAAGLVSNPTLREDSAATSGLVSNPEITAANASAAAPRNAAAGAPAVPAVSAGPGYVAQSPAQTGMVPVVTSGGVIWLSPWGALFVPILSAPVAP
jgi:hypothetical protein